MKSLVSVISIIYIYDVLLWWHDYPFSNRIMQVNLQILWDMSTHLFRTKILTVMHVIYSHSTRKITPNHLLIIGPSLFMTSPNLCPNTIMLCVFMMGFFFRYLIWFSNLEIEGFPFTWISSFLIVCLRFLQLCYLILFLVAP